MSLKVAQRLGALFIALTPCLSYAQGAWKPTGNVEIVSAVAAGGAVDKVNRVVQKIWQTDRILENVTTIENKPGGGGAIAWSYIHRMAKNPNIVSLNSSSLVTNKIVGSSTLDYSDFSTIALLFDEHVSVAVRADSPIRNAKDLVERLRKDPQSLSIGIASTLGNHIHAGIALPLKAAGVDIRKLKVVVFKSGGDGMINLLGGHVDIVSTTISNTIKLLESGKVRLVAISAPRRAGGLLANVPTWREQDVDIEFSGSMSAVAPAGLTAPQIAFWENAFRQLSQSEEWKRELEFNHWVGNFRGSAEAVKSLDAQAATLRSVLKELGLAK